MLAVALSEPQVMPYLDQVASKLGQCDLVIACFNSPESITISGEESQIHALKIILDEDLIVARKLHINVAYHSPQMNSVKAEYLSLIKNLDYGEPTPRPVIHISSVTGRLISAQEVCRGEYWVKNMVSPVRFVEAFSRVNFRPEKNINKKLDGSHKSIATAHNILEVGPHSALRVPIQETLKMMTNSNDVEYISMIVRHFSALKTTSEMLGRLHCLGHSPNLSCLNKLNMKSSDCSVALTDLPEYPFDHSRAYWHESRTSKGFRFRKSPKLDLLGSPVSDWNPWEARWRNVIKVLEVPWVADHKVCGLTCC